MPHAPLNSQFLTRTGDSAKAAPVLWLQVSDLSQRVVKRVLLRGKDVRTPLSRHRRMPWLGAGMTAPSSTSTPSYFLVDPSTGAPPLPTPTDFPAAGTAAASRVQVGAIAAR